MDDQPEPRRYTTHPPHPSTPSPNSASAASCATVWPPTTSGRPANPPPPNQSSPTTRAQIPAAALLPEFPEFPASLRVSRDRAMAGLPTRDHRCPPTGRQRLCPPPTVPFPHGTYRRAAYQRTLRPRATLLCVARPFSTADHTRTARTLAAVLYRARAFSLVRHHLAVRTPVAVLSEPGTFSPARRRRTAVPRIRVCRCL